MINPKTGDYFLTVTDDLYRIVKVLERKPDCLVVTVYNLNQFRKHPFYIFFDMRQNSNYISKYLGKMNVSQAKTAQMLYSKSITGS